MDLREIQHRRDEWVNHNFPDQDPLHPLLGVVEEVGELAHHILKQSQGIRGDGVDHGAEIKDACGDIVIFLLGVASFGDFELADVISETWERVEQRDWVKFPHDGQTR